MTCAARNRGHLREKDTRPVPILSPADNPTKVTSLRRLDVQPLFSRERFLFPNLSINLSWFSFRSRLSHPESLNRFVSADSGAHYLLPRSLRVIESAYLPKYNTC